METTDDDLQIARSYLIPARNLIEQAWTQIRKAYAHARPDCMPPRHIIDNQFQSLARRLGHGIEELEERLEGTYAEPT